MSFGRWWTSLSLHKDINVSITGVDKLKKQRFRRNGTKIWVDNVDVGSKGSKLTLTLIILHIRNFKRNNNKSFLDTIIGVGLIESDITSVTGDLLFHNKDRLGKQIYLTLKNSDYIRNGYTVSLRDLI